jgi:defect-in-organelle-trafficking protein DotC
VDVDRAKLATIMLSASEEERNIWRSSVKNGWDQGVEQANIMLTQAMDRLNRDFTGMARFHRFVVEGKVSMPAIATEDIPVTKKGDTMAIDETLLRITTLPEFSSKMAAWQGIVLSNAKASPDAPKADAAAPAVPSQSAPRR